MFLTVYLSNNDQHFTEVPITPETLCRDVVEFCKEPGEADCYLAEMWRGSGWFPKKTVAAKEEINVFIPALRLQHIMLNVFLHLFCDDQSVLSEKGRE